MSCFEKVLATNFFSHFLIFLSFLLNLSVIILTYYHLAWVYVQRGVVVEGDVYQTNINDFYLSRHPRDLVRLIEMSKYLEERVHMSQQYVDSFVRGVSFRWSDSLNCHRAILCVAVVDLLNFLISLLNDKEHRTNSSRYYSTAIMCIGGMALDCMQADSNVKIILHLNEYFNTLNRYKMRRNASSVVVDFVAVHPPGLYFAVTILRMTLKTVLFGILIGQAGRSECAKTAY